MPQLRKDPVVGRWVVISTERAKRPHAYSRRPALRKNDPCPFCPGNEGATPPEITALRTEGSRPNEPGWTLRVVPNKFPALTIERNGNLRRDGVYDLMDGLGAHEVIIESPDHDTNMGMLNEQQFEAVLRIYRERILDLRKDQRFRYIQIFKNQGAEAGETIEHTHSQVIALPIVPSHITEELSGAEKYYKDKAHCVYCDIVEQEREGNNRLVSESENFIVLCPFAPRLPFETWILPRRHSSYFEQGSEQEYVDLSRTLKKTLIRLNRSLDNPPFNYLIHSQPFEHAGQSPYHWHIEIMPRLTQIAGFEWGTGFYINPVAPEDSASALRKIPV